MESKYFDVEALEDIQFYFTDLLRLIEAFEEKDLSGDDDELVVDDFRSDVLGVLACLREACEVFGSEVLNRPLTRTELEEADAVGAWERAEGR